MQRYGAVIRLRPEAEEKYKYPHDYPGGWVGQPYRPVGLEARRYWEPEPDLEERRRRGAPGGTEKP